MKVYRITTRVDRDEDEWTEDYFLKAEHKDDAKLQFQKTENEKSIELIEETPFENIDDLKYYLVGLGPEWIAEKVTKYFLVNAINKANAIEKILKEGVGKHGTAIDVQTVRYLGKLDPNKDISQFF